MKPWSPALWIAMALTLTGACTSSESDDPAADPTSNAPDPVAVTSSSIGELRLLNTGAFRVRARDGRRERDVTGVYRIEERAHRSEVTIRAGADTARRTSILRRGKVYAELTDAAGDSDPQATCWGVGGSKALRRFDGTFEVADARNLPPALLAVGTAVGESLVEINAGDVVSDQLEINGTLDLFYVLNVYAADEAADMGVEPGEERVTATLRLVDEVISGFTVTGSDLSDATRRTGTLLGAYPESALVEADFSRTGDPVDLRLPREDRLFDLSQDTGLLGLLDCLVDRTNSRGSVLISFDARG